MSFPLPPVKYEGALDPDPDPERRFKQIADRVIAEVNPAYTRTPREALECTIRRTLEAIDNDIPGDLVECGVWKGGCSYAMLLAQRYAYGKIYRPVWMYDSFEGMSPPLPCDGADWWWDRAKDLPKDVSNEDFCICPIDEVYKAVKNLNLQDHTFVLRGWLADTLPHSDFRPDAIAALRIDCDWYEPVKCALDNLAPLVSPGGSIILDDYHAWPGCGIAIREYLETNGLSWPINEIENRNGAWLRKERT